MRSDRRSVDMWTRGLLVMLLGCAHPAAGPKPDPTSETAAASTSPAPAPGPVLPFHFAPNPSQVWGLRVARHRTLPPPKDDGDSLHFDSEENSRIWVTPHAGGHWILHDVLTSHSETKNGDPDPDEDPFLASLDGVDVALELSADGRWAGPVNPQHVLAQINENSPAGQSPFDGEKPDELAQELKRDWQFGAEVYLDRPVRQNVPVYSLMSVSLPQLASRYVVVAEVFGAASDGPEGTPWATSTEAIFGRRDPRWPEAREALGPAMTQLGVSDDEILEDFSGSGGETIDLQSLQVYQSSYEGRGTFPFLTHKGTFPLRFEIEEVAGAEAAPDLPPVHLDPMHSADATPAPR